MTQRKTYRTDPNTLDRERTQATALGVLQRFGIVTAHQGGDPGPTFDPSRNDVRPCGGTRIGVIARLGLSAVALMATSPAAAQTTSGDVVMRRPLPHGGKSPVPTGCMPNEPGCKGERASIVVAHAWALGCDATVKAVCKSLSSNEDNVLTQTDVDASACLEPQSADADADARSIGFTYMPGATHDFDAICMGAAGPGGPGQGAVHPVFHVGARMCLANQWQFSCAGTSLDDDGDVGSTEPADDAACLAQADDDEFELVRQTLSRRLPPWLGIEFTRPSEVQGAIAAVGQACGDAGNPPTISRTAFAGTCPTGGVPTSCSEFTLSGEGADLRIETRQDAPTVACEQPQTISEADADGLFGAGYVAPVAGRTLSQWCTGDGADDYAVDAVCNDRLAITRNCYLTTASGRVWSAACSDISVPGLPNSLFTHEEDVPTLLGDCSNPADVGKHLDIHKQLSQDGAAEGSTHLERGPVQQRVAPQLAGTPLGVTVCSGDMRGAASGNVYLVCPSTPPGLGNPKKFGHDVVSFTYTYALPYACNALSDGREMPVEAPDCARQRQLELTALQTRPTLAAPAFTSFQSYADDVDGRGYNGWRWFYLVPAGQFDVAPQIANSTQIAHPARMSVTDDPANKRFVVTERFYRPYTDGQSLAQVEAAAKADIDYLYGAR